MIGGAVCLHAVTSHQALIVQSRHPVDRIDDEPVWV